jgi:hypothetical protein
MAAVCPYCHSQFKVPEPRRDVQEWTPPVYMAAPEREGFRKRLAFWLSRPEIPWIKKMILLTTLAWAATCAGLGCYGLVSLTIGMIRAGAGDTVGETAGLVVFSIFAILSGVIFWCIPVTIVYFAAVFFLLVVWFVTKP